MRLGGCGWKSEAVKATPSKAALKLKRPLPDGSLRIVARGAKKDPE
jgi:hypothetical protein